MEKAKDITKNVMEKINSGRVKMHSKLYFLAKKLGLESVLILLIILAIFLVNAMFFIMQKNGIFEFSSFGFSGLSIILNNIPYDLVLIIILAIILVNFIYKKFEFNYKKPFYYFIITSILVVFAFGLIFAYSGINEEIIEEKISNDFTDTPINNQSIQPDTHKIIIRKVIPRKIYQSRIIFHPKIEQALIGEIQKIENGLLIVKTTNNLDIIVKIPNERGINIFKIGMKIKSIGELQNGVFQAKIIQIFK